MARDWFKHDINARHDVKIVLMRAKYGMAGYGAWWALIETLREIENYKLPVKHLPALCLDFDYQEIHDFINDCISEFDLLCSDGDYIWSDSLLMRMQAYDELVTQRTEAGRKGGLSKSKASAKQKGSELIRLDLNRVEKKDKKIHTDKFATQIDEVFEYFKKRTNSRVSNKTESLRSMIRARLDEGYTVDDCERAIAFAYGDKIDNPEQAKYIRIETIFRPSKFSGYLDAQLRATGGNK